MMIGCDNKVVFTTYAAARKAAERVRRKTGEVIQEYKCRDCGKYHVGHPTTESLLKKKRRKIRYVGELPTDDEKYGPETQGEEE